MQNATNITRLIRIIRFDAKKVNTKEKGSVRVYAEMSTWTPKDTKKRAARIKTICRTHQKAVVMRTPRKVQSEEDINLPV